MSWLSHAQWESPEAWVIKENALEVKLKGQYVKSHLQVGSKWGRIQMLYSKAGPKSAFITATWQVGFTSHQPVYALKSTGQNVFFVTFSPLWATFTEFKDLSSHNYKQNVPQKDLVGKIHCSESLPKPIPLQKGLIYRTTRSCKSEYQKVFPVRYGLFVVSLELCINIAFHFLHFILLHLIPNISFVSVFFTSSLYLPGASWLAPGIFVHLHTMSMMGASANCHHLKSGYTARVMGLLWDCSCKAIAGKSVRRSHHDGGLAQVDPSMPCLATGLSLAICPWGSGLHALLQCVRVQSKGPWAHRRRGAGFVTRYYSISAHCLL